MKTQDAAVVMPEVVRPDSTQPVWPTYDHDIGLTEAREMIARYKRANPENGSALAMTRVGLDRILGQKGCAGARFYFALNTDNKFTLVVVGVDEFGNDMDEGEFAEHLYRCPPYCAMDSALDS